jgi:hypothetical protein
LLCSLQAGGAVAFEQLSEDELGAVSGQDGLTVNVSTDVSAEQVRLTLDAGTANEATLRMDGVRMNAVDTLGNVGGMTGMQFDLDVGAAAANAEPYVGFNYQLNRSRLRIDDLRHEGDVGRSYGTMALDAQASIQLRGQGGIFNTNSTNTYLRGELTDAKLFYRQLWHQHPYLVLNNMNALWEIEGGKLAITTDGILMSTDATTSPYINVLFDFDILYKFPWLNGEGTEFLITGNERPLLHFGWLGSLKNAELLWRAGGAWYGTVASGVAGVGAVYDTANMSSGVRLSSRWNFVNNADANALGDPDKEFRWQLGEAARTGSDQTRVNFELSDWATWGSNTYGHNFPLIAMDVINQAQGPGGLCWGFAFDGPTSGACATGSAYSRQFVNLLPGTVSDFDPSAPRTDAKGIGLFVRDGQLQSYSRKVKILERNSAGVVNTRSFNWGLIYTLANIDANMYLYAGGNPSDPGGGSLNRGLIADIMLMSQTFGSSDNPATATVNETYTQGFNWEKGSHFMIADTDMNKNGVTGENRDAMGIGLVSSSFLLLANDTRIWIKPQWNSADYYEGGIDLMSRQARINVKGTFGGGVIPPYGGAGQEVVRGGFINLNVEGLVNFRMSPASPTATDGLNYLGYSGAIRFMNTNIADFSENTAGTSADDGSFLSISEPSNANADFRLANVQGDLAIVGGKIDMRASTEDGDSRPKMVIANTLQFGSTAATRMSDAVVGSSLPAIPSGSAAGQPFDVGRVEFGNLPLGRIVIPSGQMYTSITLKPQN